MIVEPDLPDHPKTWKLARRLSISKEAAVVLLIRIWGHCQARRDDYLGVDADDVAACARWEGKPKVLLDALIETSLVDSLASSTGVKYHAHGWRERNAGWLKKVLGGRIRAENALRNEDGHLAKSLANANHPAKLDAKHAASKQLAGPIAGGEERRGEENHHLSRAQAREALVFEARDILCRVFSRKKYLGQPALIALGEMADAGVLPLTAEDWASLERFYAERKNAAPGDKTWRTNADAIAANLAGELEKARGWLQANSITITASEKETAAVAEPQGWPSWFAAEYPGETAPESFFMLPASLRSEFGVWLSRNPELLP